MDNFINLTKMTALRDIARLLPREYFLYSDLIFYKKLANRELIKIDYESPSGGITSVDSFLKHHETELKRSQKVYLLFDNSTSMNGEKFKKLFVAKAIAIEYLRRVCREHPQIYFRSFHTDVGSLVKAATEESIYKLINHISQIQTGGGRITNIGDAIVQAIEDITADPELEQAEIMVLTDGFGPIPKDLRQQLGDNQAPYRADSRTLILKKFSPCTRTGRSGSAAAHRHPAHARLLAVLQQNTAPHVSRRRGDVQGHDALLPAGQQVHLRTESA